MTLILRLLLSIAALFFLPTTHSFCATTFQECTNGLFNPNTCECECIPPFCPDSFGDCLIPTGYCGGNPWANCQPGVSCPWWRNPLGTERCATGSTVPPGIWDIFPSQDFCCRALYPYSTVCNPPALSAPTVASEPTKNPTIAPPPEAQFEVVPVKFTLKNVFDDVDMRGLKNEVLVVLKVIVTGLAERVSGLKVSNIEERLTRGRRDAVSVHVDDSERYEQNSDGGSLQLRRFSHNNNQQQRALVKSVDLFYDITVIRNPTQKYAPIILSEIKDQYPEILNAIQEYNNGGGYVSQNIALDLCTTDGCANEVVTVSSGPMELPPDLDVGSVADTLAAIYGELLGSVQGLDVASITFKDMVDLEGGAVNIRFEVRVLPDGRDLDSLVKRKLESAKEDIVKKLREYTSAGYFALNGVELSWCTDKDGNIASTSCSSVKSSSVGMPTWLIITIVCVSILACCLLGACIMSISYQRSDEERKAVNSFHTYMHNPQLWKRYQHLEEQRKREARERRRRRPRRLPLYNRRERSPRRSRRRTRSEEEDERRRLRYEHRYYKRETDDTFNENEFQLVLANHAHNERPQTFNYPQLENGPMYYLDDEEVNRPDPPMVAGPTLLFSNRPAAALGATGVLMLENGGDGGGENQLMLTNGDEPSGVYGESVQDYEEESESDEVDEH
eukprot:scaffold13354_cov181-Alexandrium_tamarense.AAC.5